MLLWQVNADSIYFYNPQVLLDGHLGGGPEKLANHTLQQLGGWISREPNDNDPAALIRRKTEDIGKIQVQGDQAASFSTANLIKVLIGTSLQVLFADCLNIIPCSAEDLLDSGAEILIQFELHTRQGGGHTALATFRRRMQSLPGRLLR